MIWTDIWVATSEDILGLATESSTIELLTEKLHMVIPELLQLNHLLSSDHSNAIDFELITRRQESIQIAA